MTRFWLFVAWVAQCVGLSMIVTAFVAVQFQPENESGLVSGALFSYAAMLSVIPALIAELMKDRLSNRVYWIHTTPAIAWFSLLVFVLLLTFSWNLLDTFY